MKKWGSLQYNLFTAAFFALCLIPSVGMLFQGDVEAVGNERLTAKPVLQTADGTLNRQVLADFTAYFKDHLAFRHTMITADSALNAALFHVLANEDVILGDDGWLYYTQTLDDYEGVHLMDKRDCYAAARTLYLMNEYATTKGIHFLFTIAPNKNSLYPERMPQRYPASQQPGNAERLTALLSDLRVPYADLFAAFRAESDTLYFATDSHWHNRGAALASDILTRSLGLLDDAFYQTAYSMDGEHAGDLYLMAYPAGTAREADAIFDRPFTFTYDERFRSPEDIHIRTTTPGKSGSLVMFRDSFGNALHPFMAERFGHAYFSRSLPYDLTALDRESADTLVVELVERNLDYLLTSPPIMPAPLRQLTAEPAQDRCVAYASVQDAGNMDGYWKVSGHLLCEHMDADSPLYVCLGSEIYEATPSGEDENPFTLYVPTTAERSNCTVLFSVDGVLTACQLEWEAP